VSANHDDHTGTARGSVAETIAIGGDLSVGRIGFGAMQLTGKQVWGEYPDRPAAINLLRTAVDAGVTFIDTADVYGPHTNEILIREALYPYPEHLVIATKGGFVRGGFDYSTLGAVGNPNYLRQAAHTSARRLGVERIDLYYLHSGRATDASFEEQVATLTALREEGVIRYIGLSNVTLDQLRAAQAIAPIAAVTAHYRCASTRVARRRRSPPCSRRSPTATGPLTSRLPWPGTCTVPRPHCPFPAPRARPTWPTISPRPASR
jgi:aryl-alcohol dehydrogenase-like predicted oxidoreductase